MPKCETCGPGTTPTIIKAGKGLSITGAGTPTAPYEIDLLDQGAQAGLQVRDSSSINFTLTGSGTGDDPYVLSGDTGSAVSLTGLADYSSAANPTDGQFLMWSGTSASGHWTPQALPAPALPVTDASKLTSGILSNARLSGVMLDQLSGNAFSGDMNSLLAAGLYRTAPGFTNGPGGAYQYGTLLVAVAGQSVSQLYYAHGPGTHYWRTKWNASDWTSWRTAATTDDVASEAGNRAYQDGVLSSAITQLRNDEDNNVQGVRSQVGDIYNRLNNVVKIRAIAGAITPSAINTRTSQYVDFAGAFSSKPVCTVTPETGVAEKVSMTLTNITASGCWVVIVRSDNTSTTGFNIIAAQIG